MPLAERSCRFNLICPFRGPTYKRRIEQLFCPVYLHDLILRRWHNFEKLFNSAVIPECVECRQFDKVWEDRVVAKKVRSVPLI